MKRILALLLVAMLMISSVSVFADESDGGGISVAEFLLIINQAEHYSQIMEAVETYGEVAGIDMLEYSLLDSKLQTYVAKQLTGRQYETIAEFSAAFDACVEKCAASSGTASGGGGSGGGGTYEPDEYVPQKTASSSKVKLGEIVSAVTENGISAYAYAKSIAFISGDVTFVGAMYNEEILVSVDIVKKSLVAGLETKIDFEFPKAEYDRIEVFTFNNLASLMPFSAKESEKAEVLPFGVLYALYSEINGVDEEAKAVIIDNNGDFITYGFAKNVSTCNAAGETVMVRGNDIVNYLNYDDNTIQRLVYYSLNENGEINTFLYGQGIESLGYSVRSGRFDYDGIDRMMAGADVSETQFVTLTEPEYQIDPDKYSFGKTTSDGLIHGRDYSVQLIADDETDVAVFGIIFDYYPAIPYDADVMYVTSVSEVSDDQGNILRLYSGYTGNEKSSFALDMSGDYCIYDKNDVLVWDINSIREGCVIQYYLGGEVPVIKTLLSEQDFREVAWESLSGNILGTGKYDDFRGFMQAGKLMSYSDGEAEFRDGLALDIPSDAPVMLIRGDGGNIEKIYAGSEISIEYAETDINCMGENDDIVWVYMFGGEIRGAVIIDTHYDNNWKQEPAFAGKAPSFGVVSPYSDVNADDASFEEFYALNKLGYMGGFDDGSVKPDETVTRAQFITMLVRTMGLENLAAIVSEEDTPFNDIDSTHWASGYINIALNREVILPSESFGPEEEITYEEVVGYTMRALGYAPVCTTNVKSFLKASELGITGGISQKANESATRRTVAEILYNSLNVPLMEPSGVGDNVSYAVPYNNQTMLSKGNIARLEGFVTSVEFGESRQLEFEITAVAPQFDMDNYNYNGIFCRGIERISYAEDMSIIKFMPVTAYVDVSSGNPVMLFMTPKTGVKTLSLNRRQMNGGDFDGQTLGYFAHSMDEDAKMTEVRVSYDVRIYSNNDAQTISNSQFSDEYRIGRYPEIILIDSDTGRAGYDIIQVKRYYSGIVTGADYKAKRFTLESTGATAANQLWLNGCVSIKDENGNALKVSDIKTGNVISISESCDNEGYVFTEVTVSENIIEGRVEEDCYNGCYIINGSEYYSDIDLEAGLEGFFFTDMYDAIIRYSEEEPVIGEGGPEEEEETGKEEIIVENGVDIKSPFADMKSTDKYFEAMYTLNFLDILNGYEDGTAKPEGKITRAEFIAVLIRALGYEETAKAFSGTGTCFEDVPGEHWVSGYINVALNCGILEEGDYFRPAEEVSYGEAVKFTVGALGYTPLCEMNEYNPELSYLCTAAGLGLITEASLKYSDDINRGMTAQLIFNALDVQMMEQLTFGAVPEYGVPGASETFLSMSKIARLEGIVEDITFSNKVKKLSFGITKVAKQYEGGGLYFDGPFQSGDVDDFGYADGVEIKKFMPSAAYVDMSNPSKPCIIGMYPSGAVKTLTLTGKQIRGGWCDLSSGWLEYFKNSAEEDLNTTNVRLSNSCRAFENMNSMSVPYGEFRNKYERGSYSKITLIDNEPHTNGYDVIVCDSYYSAVVYEINEKNMRVAFDEKYNTSKVALYLDPTAEDYSFSISDEDGNPVMFEEIKAGDVITVYESEDYNANIYFDVVVSRNIIEGRVYTVKNNGNIVIDGNEYAVSSDVMVNVGDMGKFYIDVHGNVVGYKSVVNAKFGVLYALYEDTNGIDNEPKAIIIDSEGNFITYDFAKNVNINGDGYGRYKTVKKDYILNDVEPGQKLVMFEVNSDNQIKEFFWGDGISLQYERYSVVEERNDGYRASTSKLGRYLIPEDFSFVTLSDNYWQDEYYRDKEAFGIAGENALSENAPEDYKYDAIVDRDSEELIFAVLFDFRYYVDRASDIMYVTSVGTGMDSKGNRAKIITGNVNGENVSFKASEPYGDVAVYNSYDEERYSVSDISGGNVIQYVLDENNEARAIRLLLSNSEIEEIKNDEYSVMLSSDENDDWEGFIIAGQLEKYKRSIAMIDGYEFELPDDSLSMMLKDGKIFANDKITPEVAETDAKCYEDGTNGDYVWVYKFAGETKAVVIIDSDADNPEYGEGSDGEDEPSVEPEKNYKFGALYALYEDANGIDKEPKAIIIDSEGNFTTYDFAKNININGNGYGGYKTVKKDYVLDDVEPGQKLVMFATNSNNDINEFYWGEGIELRDERYAAMYSRKGIYNESLNKLGLFKIPEEFSFLTLKDEGWQSGYLDKYSFGTADLNSLSGDAEYNYEAIVDENGQIVFAVLFDYKIHIDRGSDVMYVTSVGTGTDAEGNKAKIITGTVGGEKVSFTATEAAGEVVMYDAKDVESKATVADIAKGDVLQFALNADNEALAIRVLFDASGDAALIEDGEYAVKLGDDEDDDELGFIIAGMLDEYVGRTAVFAGKEYEVSSSVAAMLIRGDRVFATDEITIGVAETNEYVYEEVYEFDDENGDFVWVYKFDGETKAIVIIDTDSDDIWN